MWINYVRSFVTGSVMFTQINNELSFTKTCIKCDKSFKNSSLKLIFFLINQNWLFLFSSVLNHPSFFYKNWPAASGTYQKGLDRPAAETGSRVRGLSPARPHPVLTRSYLNVCGAPIWPRFVDEITSVFCLFVLLFSSFFFSFLLFYVSVLWGHLEKYEMLSPQFHAVTTTPVSQGASSVLKVLCALEQYSKKILTIVPPACFSEETRCFLA